ncbi:MAG TPA: DUF1778 domain-containing protein [Opitutaceae bacterium]|nr:DUF1778 domain-containing protein [Opitutaceae bacterium]
MQTLPRRRPVVSAPATENRTARLEARVPAVLKEILFEAARLTGHSSVTSYIVQTLQDSASRTVQQSRRTQMDAAESAVFVQSLLAPSVPAPVLQAAFARYREQVR